MYLNFVIYTLLWLCFLHIDKKETNALECYVCTNQEKNKDKCITTIKTCEQEEDMCLSEIKWGSPPYWSRGSAKQYYISKRCSTRENCTRIIKKTMPLCTYIWYNDWQCAECCSGDRCNYYITTTGSIAKYSVYNITFGLLFIVIVKLYLFN